MASKPPKAKGKGKGKGKGQPAEDETGNAGGIEIKQRTNASWSDPLVKILLNVCREFHKVSGLDQQFKWGEITAKFQQVSGKMYNQETVKNKFDYVKKIWSYWNDLRYKETGCGWDHCTGLVDATDEWWEKKLKESDKYKRFRKKGVDPETSELWDQVFGFTTATGRHCVSPSMAPKYQTVLAIMPGHPAEVLNEVTGHETSNLIDMDQRLIDEINQDALNNIRNEDNNFLDQVHHLVTGVSSSPSTCALVVGKKNVPSSSGSTRARKKSKSTSYMERFGRMEERGDKFLALWQEEITSSSVKGDTPTRGCEQLDAMSALKDLVNEGLVEEGSDLWCFALSELRKPESCIAFMDVDKSQMRLIWLQYEYKIHNARLGLS